MVLFERASSTFPWSAQAGCCCTWCEHLGSREGQLHFGLRNISSLPTCVWLPCSSPFILTGLMLQSNQHWSQQRTASNINAYGYGMSIQAESTPRKIADPFDFGGGQIDPNRASDPGLVYDIDPREYFEFFNCTAGQFSVCAQALDKPVYDLNLPAISVPDLMTSKIVWRRVTNVGEVDSVYKVLIESPPGVRVAVQPPVLVFNATAKVHGFKVTFMAAHKLQGDYVFGSLTWFDGGDHVVRIPIAVRVVIQDFYADVA